MCGRARCTLRADDISRACYRSHGPVRTVDMDRYRPSYNVSPGANLPVVRRVVDGGDGIELHSMKWGLIPSFTKKTEKPDHYRMFNARSESIREKASFRRLLPKNRCIIAVEGFYEWKKDGTKKQPYYIHFTDCRPLLFAALYDFWENAEGEKLNTFTIITTSSSSALAWLHDRMPVILGDKESIDTWLNESSSSNIDKLLKPYEGPDLVWYPVTPAMGKVSFNGPECIDEIQLKSEGTNSITKFFSSKGMGTRKEELKSRDTSSHASPMKIDFAESIKREPENKEGMMQPSLTAKYEENSRSSVSKFSQEGANKGQMKRDYEEFSTDIKPDTKEIDEISSASPAKKKINMKGSHDKQPTLFSYFGKT